MELRDSTPAPVAVVDPRMGEDGMEWHEDGVEVPWWGIGAAITMLGVLLGLVLLAATVDRPANRPDDPGRVATPTTYGPLVGW